MAICKKSCIVPKYIKWLGTIYAETIAHKHSNNGFNGLYLIVKFYASGHVTTIKHPNGHNSEEASPKEYLEYVNICIADKIMKS